MSRELLRQALERLSAAALARDNTMGDACTLLAAKAELADANREACAVLAAQPAPVPLTDEQFADIVADASIAADLAADPF